MKNKYKPEKKLPSRTLRATNSLQMRKEKISDFELFFLILALGEEVNYESLVLAVGVGVPLNFPSVIIHSTFLLLTCIFFLSSELEYK